MSIDSLANDAKKAAAHEHIDPREALAATAETLIKSYREIHMEICRYVDELNEMGLPTPTEFKREVTIKGANPKVELADVPSGSVPATDLTTMIRGYITMNQRLGKNPEVKTDRKTNTTETRRFTGEYSGMRPNDVDYATLNATVKWTVNREKDKVEIRTKLEVVDEGFSGFYASLNDEISEEGDCFTPAEFSSRAAYDATAGQVCPLTLGAIETMAAFRDQLAYKAQEVRDGIQKLNSPNRI